MEVINCETCGDLFNPAYLDQVAKHMHDDLEVKQLIKGKNVISHARDVYEHCSGDFANGVHSYLKGEPYPRYPESKEMMQGYSSAERDLKDNFILQR